MAKISNLHEVLASEDVGTAGGGDEDVATVNTVLDCGHLQHFKFNGEFYLYIISGDW